MKICFVAPDAYAAAVNAAGSHIGGAETQQFQFAKALRSKGYEVSFIVARPASIEESEDVKLPSWVKVAYSLRDHPSKMGFIKDSLKLFNVMKTIRADICIQRCSFHDASRVWLFSKILEAKFLFWVGIDYNVDIDWLQRNLSIFRKYSYLFAIKNANSVVCQTQFQAKLLKNISNTSSAVIRNIVVIPEQGDEALSGERPKALWGGRINPRKNPNLLLELAEKLPSWDFVAVIVKERGYLDLYNDFGRKADNLPNFLVIHSLPHAEYIAYYDKVELVINTSSAEGYPNTLLEAFARGVPALTLGIDPDSVINEYNIGWVCNGINEAAETMKQLANQPESLHASGKRAIAYVREFHSEKRVIKYLENVLEILMERNRD